MCGGSEPVKNGFVNFFSNGIFKQNKMIYNKREGLCRRDIGDTQIYCNQGGKHDGKQIYLE